jgi:hypothetical protein
MSMLKVLRLMGNDGMHDEETSVSSVPLGNGKVLCWTGEEVKPTLVTEAEWVLYETRQAKQQVDLLAQQSFTEEWEAVLDRDLWEGITRHPA